MDISKSSPIEAAHQHLSAKTTAINGMNIATEYEGGSTEATRKQNLGVCDVSAFPRFGIKGANAQSWLSQHKVSIPELANGWTKSTADSLVLRLGNSEFLVEDHPASDLCAALNKACPMSDFGLYPVPRYDSSFMLSGQHVLSLLAELCSLDLGPKSLGNQQLFMTQVAGISATVLRQTLNGEDVYRLWCDGTYGAYMWDTLIEIAEEFDGGAVGLNSYFTEII